MGTWAENRAEGEARLSERVTGDPGVCRRGSAAPGPGRAPCALCPERGRLGAGPGLELIGAPSAKRCLRNRTHAFRVIFPLKLKLGADCEGHLWRLLPSVPVIGT